MRILLADLSDRVKKCWKSVYIKKCSNDTRWKVKWRKEMSKMDRQGKCRRLGEWTLLRAKTNERRYVCILKFPSSSRGWFQSWLIKINTSVSNQRVRAPSICNGRVARRRVQTSASHAVVRLYNNIRIMADFHYSQRFTYLCTRIVQNACNTCFSRSIIRTVCRNALSAKSNYPAGILAACRLTFPFLRLTGRRGLFLPV